MSFQLLRTMTPKQERFVEAYLIDGNATKAAIAAGYSPKTARSIGQRLLTNVDIASRLQEYRQKASETALVSLVSHLEDLKALRDAAKEAGQYGPAITAEIARGKAGGVVVEKSENKSENKTEITVTFRNE